MGRKRLARLMQQGRIQGSHRRRRISTTKRSLEQRAAPDVVRPQFTVDGSGEW